MGGWMNRRRFTGLPLTLLAATAVPRFARGADYADVVPGRVLRFPADEGSHPEFRIEWWYATGWLADAAGRPLGFQITFFRHRAVDTQGNPSRFAPAHLIVAHAALSDPRRGRLLHEQRVARAGFGLAEAASGMTDARIGNWYLRADGETSTASGTLSTGVSGREFGLELTLSRTQLPLLHGEQGFSAKGPGALAASYYYTLPQLTVNGRVVADGTTSRVSGTAWLDHEWSTASMDAGMSGWDWMGINLDDGGALMAFRMRSATGATYWSGATLRTAAGRTQSYGPGQVVWTARRSWRSPRTGATYPVSWRVAVGDLLLEVEPLMDDQEQDARASTGTVYWEGAVTVRLGNRSAGRGYLELTGYWRPFRL